MERTLFAGLTRLEPGESLATDNASFQSDNPRKIDRLLEIGAVTHRHDAHAALGNPAIAASGSAVASGGAIPSDSTIYIGYTLLDFENGETELAPDITIVTQPPIDDPESSPMAEIDYTGGELMVDTYYYAVSLIDQEGGETPLGPTVMVEREPGFASGQVQVSGLTAVLTESGAAAWRMWRAAGGGEFYYIGSGAVDTFTDNGRSCVDCGLAPVEPNQNFTNSDNSLLVVVPSAAMDPLASAYAVYASTDPAFNGPSLMGIYPVASAGTTHTYTALIAENRRPPVISTTVPGASLIDPDTDILDFPWKRTVPNQAGLPSGAALGDVRVTLDTGSIWVFAPSGAGSAWTDRTGSPGGGGSGAGGSGAGPLPLGSAYQWLDAEGAVAAEIVGLREGGSTTLALDEFSDGDLANWASDPANVWQASADAGVGRMFPSAAAIGSGTAEKIAMGWLTSDPATSAGAASIDNGDLGVYAYFEIDNANVQQLGVTITRNVVTSNGTGILAAYDTEAEEFSIRLRTAPLGDPLGSVLASASGIVVPIDSGVVAQIYVQRIGSDIYAYLWDGASLHELTAKIQDDLAAEWGSGAGQAVGGVFGRWTQPDSFNWHLVGVDRTFWAHLIRLRTRLGETWEEFTFSPDRRTTPAGERWNTALLAANVTGELRAYREGSRVWLDGTITPTGVASGASGTLATFEYADAPYGSPFGKFTVLDSDGVPQSLRTVWQGFSLGLERTTVGSGDIALTGMSWRAVQP